MFTYISETGALVSKQQSYGGNNFDLKLVKKIQSARNVTLVLIQGYWP